MLKEKSGIVYAELLAERDGDACTYMIESAVGVDIRKSLFYTLAERGWPLIGLEAQGMNLEDIFITIVDSTDKPQRRDSRRKVVRSTKDALEREYARDILDKTAAKKTDRVDGDDK
jgi:hypothetical protein